MSDCSYCDESLSSRKKRLEHELDEHQDKMSSHDKSDKKSELNRLEQKATTKKHNRKKKMKYGGIATVLGIMIIGGGFLAAQNIDNVTPVNNSSIGVGEPIHWHANYQLTVCGEDRILQGGPKLAHTHGQKQFHLEGVRQTREQATLDTIVDNLGGKMENNSIMGKTSCNDEPADLTVKANGNKLENPLEYIPRDGDNIAITLE